MLAETGAKRDPVATVTMHSGSGSVVSNLRMLSSEHMCLGSSLLNHNGLMTPHLGQVFGTVYAIQHIQEEVFGVIHRESSLYQLASDIKILDASLGLVSRSLPDAVLRALKSTQIPFGQLLIDNEIEAEISNCTLFTRDNSAGDQILGRRHTILDSSTGEPLCHVEERLAPEHSLIKAKKFFWSKK